MAIVPIQIKAEQSSASVASFTTTAMTITAGNAIVACMSSSANTSLTASDSHGNSYADVVTKSAATPISVGQDVCANIATGGSTTFTVTPGATSFCSISAQEYSGMATSAPAEATNSAGPTTSTAINPGAVNPASSNDLYVSCWSQSGGTATFTFNASGEGWTQRANLTNGSFEPLGSQDLVASGSKTGSATLQFSQTWVACVATYKAAQDVPFRRFQTRPFPFTPGAPRSQ